MARPGFVLEVDDRTPPMVVPHGVGFRLERFPMGTSVVYPPEPLAAVPDVTEAIDAALDAPLDSAPLTDRLHRGMRLVIAFDDVTTPVPRMPQPDIRGRIVEAVLRRAAEVGVDDVVLIGARGLHRRMTEAELLQLLGERVFRSFYADGKLGNHDAEDAEQLSVLSSSDESQLSLNAAAAQADLLVHVHIADHSGNGALATAYGLGSTATVSQLTARPGAVGESSPEEIELLVSGSVNLFTVEAVLDNAAYSFPLQFLGKREWEWSLKDRAAWLAVRRGVAVTSVRARSRIRNAARAGYAPIQIAAGAPAAVARASARQVAAQRLVEVDGQADIAVLGVPQGTPYSADSITNPILAAWSALSAGFAAHTGRPVVRPGGALILYHSMQPDFSPLHHPSYLDLFADVLPATTDATQIAEKFEQKYATDPWYRHLYQTSYAFHGVHPLHLWYEMAAARAHCGDIIWVGAHRPTVERLGFRAASTLADALEIVSSTVGRSPAITYLHNSAQLVTDVR
ncbi:MAG TPA: lactate racemase domain-containing protein [Propionibacteriaceae bacterium]|nr:lactate racemase domain-containing protein [Propionibacteriaceae bacterium]